MAENESNNLDNGTRREAELKAEAKPGARPSRAAVPSRSDKEAYEAWLKQLKAPDRSNCRA